MKTKFVIVIVLIFCYVFSFSQVDTSNTLHIISRYDTTYLYKDKYKSQNDKYAYAWNWYKNNYRYGLRKDVPDGYYKLYWDSTYTTIGYEGKLKNSMKDGKWIYYFPNGKVDEIIEYKEDKRNGEYTKYNHLGQKVSYGKYENGRMVDTTFYYGKKLYRTTMYTQESNLCQIYECFYGISANGFNIDTPYIDMTCNDMIYGYSKKGKYPHVIYFDSIYGVFNEVYYEKRKLGWYSGYYLNSLKEYSFEKSRNPIITNREDFNYYSNKANFYSVRFEVSQYMNIEEVLYQIQSLDKFINARSISIDLERLDTIYYDTIIKSIPNLKNLSKLEEFKIQSYGISMFPEGIKECQNLKSVDFNSVKGVSNFEVFVKLTTLEAISIWGWNWEPDSLISICKTLPKLKAISIYYTSETYDPNRIFELNNLEVIATAGNYYGDKGKIINIESFEKMPNLRYVATNNLLFEDVYKASQVYPNIFLSQVEYTCLTKGTLINASYETTKKVEEISVGDSVLCYDFETNELKNTVVTKVHKTSMKPTVKVKINSENVEYVVECTIEHPFYVYNKGWLEAKNLSVSDSVILYNPKKKVVEVGFIEDISEESNEFEPVYNFETETHNYFANGILVHNK